MRTDGAFGQDPAVAWGEGEASSRVTSAPQRRRRRRGERSRSIRVARATREERQRAEHSARYLESQIDRPHTRDACIDGPRPCPFVACRHHLYLDVSPTTGTIKFNFPDLEVWELAESCALDVAEAGAQPPERASSLLNVTRERIRQIEAVALARLSMVRDLRALRDWTEVPPPPRRRR